MSANPSPVEQEEVPQPALAAGEGVSAAERLKPFEERQARILAHHRAEIERMEEERDAGLRILQASLDALTRQYEQDRAQLDQMIAKARSRFDEQLAYSHVLKRTAEVALHEIEQLAPKPERLVPRRVNDLPIHVHSEIKS